MSSFWVYVDEHDEPDGDWLDFEQLVELTEDRGCGECERRWKVK
jgi:hypothetical protein